MAKDDYFKIIYLILTHLYKQMKKGKSYVDIEVIKKDIGVPPIPVDYFNEIVIAMIEKVLIQCKGFYQTNILDEDEFEIDSMKITYEGCEYLQENSMMKKVKETLGLISDLK